MDDLSPKEQQRALLVLRMHVMDSVRRRVEVGQRELIIEIRSCTLVFFGFPSLKACLPSSPCSRTECPLCTEMSIHRCLLDPI